MRHTHDQFSKQAARNDLEPRGMVETQREVLLDAQTVDVFFEPHPPERQPGPPHSLLAELVDAGPCLIEPCHVTPGPDVVDDYLRKKLALGAELTRQRDTPVPTLLWIVSAGEPLTVIDRYGFAQSERWPEGILVAPEGFGVGLVIVSWLPTTRRTLTLRAMGRGRVQRQAFEEARALGPGVWEHDVIWPVLVRLRMNLSTIPRDELDAEEREFLMNTRQAYENFVRETEQRGETRGLLEARRQDVLECLEVRGFDIDDEIRARIESCEDPERLSRWLRGTITAESVDEVFSEG